MATKVISKFKLSHSQTLLLFLGVAVVGVIVLLASHAASGNLVHNASFETALLTPTAFPDNNTFCLGKDGYKDSFKYWTGCYDAGVTNDREQIKDAPDGSYVFHLKLPGGKIDNTINGGVIQRFKLKDGCTYDASAQYKHLSGHAQRFTFFVNYAGHPAMTSTTSGGWQRLKVKNVLAKNVVDENGNVVGPPVGAISIDWFRRPAGPQSDYYWDDVSLIANCGQ